MSLAVGIDLGTTFSSLAIMDEYDRPQVQSNDGGQRSTPSIIFFEDGKNPIVGEIARNVMGYAPEHFVNLVKRDMGKANYTRYIDNDMNEYSPEILSALILKKLKTDAEIKLGKDIKNVVITVPAYFNDKQKLSTMQACEIAGLNVVRVINEPTAAALSYARKRMDENQTLLIYDLGGGTFDVSIVMIYENKVIVKATSGDPFLGGIDFDETIYNLVKSEFLKNYPTETFSKADEFQIKYYCETLKKNLSVSKKTMVRYTTESGLKINMELTRELFEDMTKDLLEKTKRKVIETLDASQLSWNDIDKIVLVGGSSKMPMIKNMLTSLSGKEIKQDLEPDLCVAEGAAIAALHESKGSSYFKDGFDWEDITSHGLGVAVLKPNDRSNTKYNSLIIPKFSKLPAKGTKKFALPDVNSTSVIVDIYQGEHDETVDKCCYIGRVALEDIPKRHIHPSIEITFEYDKNGLIHVNILDLFSGKNNAGKIDQRGNLSDEQVSRGKEHIKEFILSTGS